MTGRMRPVVSLVLILLACRAGLPSPLRAQEQSAQVRLTLIDAVTAAPISRPQVTVQPRAAVHVARDGVVTLRDLWPGAYLVTIAASGYHTWVDTLRVDRPGRGESTIRLQPSAIPLDPITAAGRSRVPILEVVGFYSRRSSGFGHFIDREAIERQNAASLLDLLHTVPRSRVVSHNGRRTFVLHQSGTQCDPMIFLDGVRARDAFLLDDIPPLSVEGVELYVGSVGTPLEWRRNACGSLLIWTRSGRRSS